MKDQNPPMTVEQMMTLVWDIYTYYYLLGTRNIFLFHIHPLLRCTL